MRCFWNASHTCRNISLLRPRYRMASISHQVFRAVRLIFAVLGPDISPQRGSVTGGFLTELRSHHRASARSKARVILIAGDPSAETLVPRNALLSSDQKPLRTFENHHVGRQWTVRWSERDRFVHHWRTSRVVLTAPLGAEAAQRRFAANC